MLSQIDYSMMRPLQRGDSADRRDETVMTPVTESGVAASSRTARTRRAQRALPGAALLSRLVGDPAAAPEWLKLCAASLEDANNPRRKLLARLKDAAQVLHSLDRLYAARLGEVQQWFESPLAAGRTLAATLPLWMESLFSEVDELLRDRLLPGVAAAGTQLLPVDQVDEGQRTWLHQYFTHQVYPLLTPLAVDPGRPFPYISSDSLNLLVELRRPEALAAGLRGERAALFARVKIPPTTPHLVAVPMQPASLSPEGAAPSRGARYVYSADLVRFFVDHLFTGMPVRHVYLFRVVRGATALPGTGGRAASRRRRQENQPVVRLDVERRMGEPMLGWLMEHLQVPAYGVTRHDNLLESAGLPHVIDLMEKPTASARR